jgi:Ca2+-binding EF-hand superfamily protein
MLSSRESLILGLWVALVLLPGMAIGQDSVADVLQGDSAGSRSPLPERFREADRNGDGELQRDEAPISLLPSFDQIDQDHDNKIDSYEIWEFQLQKQREAAAAARSIRRSPVADTKQPKTVSTLVELIEFGDSNGDQQLSFDEMPRSLQESFSRLDLDADGFLDLEEARKLDAPRSQSPVVPRQRSMQRVVGLMDTDGDGLLQKKEAPLRVQQIFEQVDRNGDGAIDLDEARAKDSAAVP